MTAYKWVRVGTAFGLRPQKGIGNIIVHWVIKGKNGAWYEQDGVYQEGLVHGSHKTKLEAMKAVEARLQLQGLVCAQCGSPLVLRR